MIRMYIFNHKDSRRGRNKFMSQNKIFSRINNIKLPNIRGKSGQDIQFAVTEWLKHMLAEDRH